MAAWRGVEKWREQLSGGLDELRERWLLAEQAPVAGSIVLLLILLDLGLGWYWSQEPELFPVTANISGQGAPVPGYVLASTTEKVARTLLDKPGGYISNDMLPPGLFMDNMPAWELGVVHQLRDMTRALHRDMSVSRALYTEDHDLASAETQFNFDTNSWLFPSTESQYRRGIDSLHAYAGRLALNDGHSAQFYPRADYLNHWLSDVDVSLGRLTAELNAALPQQELAPTAGEALPSEQRTPWSQIDDVFYESRGSAWALIHLLKAVEIDFGPELKQHNAQLSLRAAIHELEATQQTVWSPVILNGSGFGLFANHSLVMANYLSRAQADLKDVRELMQQ